MIDPFAPDICLTLTAADLAIMFRRDIARWLGAVWEQDHGRRLPEVERPT